MDTWVRPVTKLSTQLLKTLWPTTVKFSIKISILSIALTRREHLYTAYECEQHIWQRLKFHVLFLEAFGLQPAKYMVFKDIVCCISSKIEIIGLGYFARLLSMYELLCPTIGYELLRPTVFLRAWGTSPDGRGHEVLQPTFFCGHGLLHLTIFAGMRYFTRRYQNECRGFREVNRELGVDPGGVLLVNRVSRMPWHQAGA